MREFFFILKTFLLTMGIMAAAFALKAAPSLKGMDDQPIRVFVGYDEKHPIGYLSLVQSIVEHSSAPVAITPLYLSTIKRAFKRAREPGQLTDFSYSRFIVPYLCNYKGWAIFMDGNDMMLREDIAKLWALRNDLYAVMVVKHPEFKGMHSFGGKKIKTYPRLNWSSMMLINTKKCKVLTPEYVNTANYYDLHQFKWLESPHQIGELPNHWNHLVGYYPHQPHAALVHWTLGAPYQGGEFAKAEHAAEWFNLYNKIIPLEE